MNSAKALICGTAILVGACGANNNLGSKRGADTTAVGITNGGFETGDLTGWTATGVATVVNTKPHSGSYSVELGSTAASSDSTVAQTFIAPAGATELSFWYLANCPGTDTQWATAMLVDNTSLVGVKVLDGVCVSPGVWLRAVATLTPGDSYTLTLINHDDNSGTSPNYTFFDDIAVGPAPMGAIQNGGFETGDVSGWTAAGTTSASTAAHSGKYAAQLGDVVATNGDSSLVQNFTAPAGSGVLSLWYLVSCPDTVEFDWAAVTLYDSTDGTLINLLNNTCDNIGRWAQISTAVIPGHSYTLTLLNHDDNTPEDPTYTLFDDVVIE